MKNKEVKKEHPYYKRIRMRLIAARCNAGYPTATDFVLAHNLKLSTYLHHEAGSRKMQIETLVDYSLLLGKNPSSILAD